ncbi:MAG: hypothetical protein UX56_C0013G0013 [Candidatus Azambacteria bacterium GW2011_GWD2_46_48]|uniref:Uncharacterized protein n=1 Tax=Candidatus Azambacteria bacterium GW2011_GWD2_46_48 TaxID=1618623 RepID=A0A0G1T9I8_9BACT|nr:MAG: hypothetical protein UX56_C0013G0013 [Candidatus Azambacteria bacterium GW2011_GWD2_46_48]
MVEHPVCIREIGVRFPSGPPKTPPEYSGGVFDVETLYLREAANLFAAGKGVGETQFPRVGNQRQETEGLLGAKRRGNIKSEKHEPAGEQNEPENHLNKLQKLAARDAEIFGDYGIDVFQRLLFVFY